MRNPVQTGYLPGAIVGFTPFNFAQEEAVGLILANVASFAKLSFVLIPGPPDPLANTAANFRYAMATTIDYTNNGTGVHVPGGKASATPPPGTAEGNWPELPGNYHARGCLVQHDQLPVSRAWQLRLYRGTSCTRPDICSG